MNEYDEQDDRYGMGCPDYGDNDTYEEVEDYD